MPLNYTQRKCKESDKFIKSQEQIKLFIYMVDIKIFDKNEKEHENLIGRIRIHSQDIGIEFGLEKCGVFIIFK